MDEMQLFEVANSKIFIFFFFSFPRRRRSGPVVLFLYNIFQLFFFPFFLCDVILEHFYHFHEDIFNVTNPISSSFWFLSV